VAGRWGGAAPGDGARAALAVEARVVGGRVVGARAVGARVVGGTRSWAATTGTGQSVAGCWPGFDGPTSCVHSLESRLAA